MSDLESRLRIMCQCGQPSYAGTPITPPCWACEANARVNDLTEALELLVALPVTYNGNRIEIEAGSHGEAMAIVRKARAALARSPLDRSGEP